MIIDFPKQYGLIYPIQKTPGNWIVVGATGDFCTDIHLDADDPNFEFATYDEWPGLEKKVIDQYNFPYTKEGRLLLRRATAFDSNIISILNNHDRAAALIKLERIKRLHPSSISMSASVGSFTVGFIRHGAVGNAL